MGCSTSTVQTQEQPKISNQNQPPQPENVVIIGGGPGGLTAAIYTARAGLSPIVFCGAKTHSQLMTTTEVENYPGFKSVQGPQLVQNIVTQAQSCGAKLIYQDVQEIDLSTTPFKITHNDTTTFTKSIIFATGSKALRNDVPGEKKYWQRGISACAVCDGRIAKGKVAMIVGGGDVACEEAIYLTKEAEKVYQVLRRDQFRASKAMVQRVLANEKIEVIYDSEVQEVTGEERLQNVVLRNGKTGETKEMGIQALFWCIGHTPQTSLLTGKVDMEGGYIQLKTGQMTSQSGVFAAGDCCDPRYRQAVAAAGSGAMAALDCERWLAQ